VVVEQPSGEPELKNAGLGGGLIPTGLERIPRAESHASSVTWPHGVEDAQDISFGGTHVVTDQLIQGDALAAATAQPTGSLAAIYIDPPFGTGLVSGAARTLTPRVLARWRTPTALTTRGVRCVAHADPRRVTPARSPTSARCSCTSTTAPCTT